MAPSPRWHGRHLLRLGVGDELSVAHRVVVDGELEQSVEEEPSARRASARIRFWIYFRLLSAALTALADAVIERESSLWSGRPGSNRRPSGWEADALLMMLRSRMRDLNNSDLDQGATT